MYQIDTTLTAELDIATLQTVSIYVTVNDRDVATCDTFYSCHYYS